ncbi:MAG: hypothetical protein NC299_17210 [Lachnospiraceae bacterium]|nr:hypothetical protein [Ruminococcus sp.]MCM1277070.1 hypothetical protein [Lachnospiraceae bacterium]
MGRAKNKINIESVRANISTGLIEKEHELSQVKQDICEFLSLYILCETTYWNIMKECKKPQNKQAKKDGINISSIKAVIKQLDLTRYNSDIIIESVFGGTGKYTLRYSKSCKMLRHCIVHNLSSNDINEVIERKDKLFADMNAFLDLVRQTPPTENESKYQSMTV